ncbi:MAG: hypothetical protein ACOYJZ_07645 [Acutalibacter sp.]|jgi:hypothetical protein
MAQDNNDFTLEDILAEQRAKRELQEAEKAAAPQAPNQPVRRPAQQRPAPQGQAHAQQRPAPQGQAHAQQRPAPQGQAHAQQRQAPQGQAHAQQRPAPQGQAYAQQRPAPQGQAPAQNQAPAEDLNSFATGSVELPLRKEDRPAAPAPEAKPEKGKKKKKGFGLFGRKKRMPDFDENEDDMYYGIQLKPIDEYRMGYDSAGELTSEEETYKALFDDSKKAIDQEVEANFQKLQRERRRRVAEAVQTAGVDAEEIADEFGVVAPMPVTSFAADPYAKQHGIGVEGGKKVQEDMADIQKAMLDASDQQTMEIKLNVLNDTVELQRIGNESPVSQEAIGRVLDSPAPMDPVDQEPEEPVEELPVQEPVEEPLEELPAQEPEEEPLEELPPEEPVEALPPEEAPVAQAPAQPALRVVRREEAPAPAVDEPTRAIDTSVAQPQAPASAPQQEPPRQAPQQTQQAAAGRSRAAEPPQINSIYEYRPRSVPTHVIHAEVLQSALLSESEELRQRALKEERQQQRSGPKRRVRNKKLEVAQEPEEAIPDADTGEPIDDYTGPEDAKSISHELRSDMRELTMRLMITGVCTVLLAIVNLIFGGQLTGPGDPGSLPVVYVVLTLVFLAVAVGMCFRTVANGLRALFAFNANSDSAVAVAAVAVIVQAVAAAFFQDSLSDGALHLYAVVLSAALFLNTAGKLTMIRRIHSNFRFVTSREQKYSVRIYDDHNTALKMAKDCVAETPVIAYQCRAGFLKRFMDLSYKPDPSESSSQLMAPIGLIASLILCIATLLITSSVATAISAFAAASCACVAVSNMLSVNLPISRLCRTARRAGAMVVSYEGVEQLGNVNAVMVDAEDLFPRGTVVLAGIKTFGGRAVAEDAIMAASALMKEAGGPLAGVFDQVISENEDALPQVESFSYEEGGEIVGKVDGSTILIGSRALFINHQIQVPPREEESQYASGNQQVVYIGVGDAVRAMLVLTYAADRRRRNELQRLENSGISVIVRSTDPNVTPQLISRLFGIDTASVGVLDTRLGEEYRKLAQTEIPRADALVATKGRVESLMNVVSACVEERRTVGMVVAIQTAAVVLGFVLVAFLACFGAMGQLSSLVLFLFQMFWTLITILVPKLRQ